MYYGGYYGMYWDPTYILVIIGMVICLLASARVKSTYAKFNRVRSHSGITAAEAARKSFMERNLCGGDSTYFQVFNGKL